MRSFLALPARSRATMLTILAPLVPGACRAPEAAPLDAGSLARSVGARSAASEQLAAALELAGLRPLSLAPPPPEVLSDPEAREFWHTCAWVFAPAMRAARRRVEAARAAAGSAGRSGPIEGMLEVEDLGDPAAFTRVFVTFDLIGLLGLGPAASARALADAETRAALGQLEEAMWSTRYAVDAARARLTVLRAAQEQLRSLSQEAEADSARMAILERHGRLAAEALAAARLATSGLDRRLAQLALEEAQAREGLALAAGLAPDAPALAASGEHDLALLLDMPTSAAPTAEELLARLPGLRSAFLDYAIAEARLRDEAAQRWPGLRLGPQLLWSEPDFFAGAVLGSDVPWPGALDGRIVAASVEREAARERVEDALLAAELRRAAAEERRAAADALLARGARPAVDASARLWSAARASFAVEPAALMDWATALGMRAEAVETHARARAELALATLEREQAIGPGPEIPRLVRALEARP
jgi:outer membrane protein TolC